jgi:hypothetical protein
MTQMIMKPDGIEEAMMLIPIILEQFFNDLLGLGGCRKVDEAGTNDRG